MSAPAVRITKPTKQGWLEKQSRHLRVWRKRWFVLEGNILYSFKDDKSLESPTEIIDLKTFSSVKSSEDFTGRESSFDVYSVDMAFSLCASTKEEKEEWIRCIGKAIVASRRGDAWQDDVDAYGNPRENKN